MSRTCQSRHFLPLQNSPLFDHVVGASPQGCGFCDRLLRASASALILSTLALSASVALPSRGFVPMASVSPRDVLYPLVMAPDGSAGPMAVEGPRLALAASITAFSRARAASAAVGAARATGAAVGAVRTTGAAARATGAGATRTAGAAAGAVRTTGAAARATGAGATRTAGAAAGAVRTTGAAARATGAGATRTAGAAAGAVRTTGAAARATGAGATRTAGAAAGAVRTTGAAARATGAGAARATGAGAGAARTTGAGAGDDVVVVFFCSAVADCENTNEADIRPTTSAVSRWKFMARSPRIAVE